MFSQIKTWSDIRHEVEDLQPGFAKAFSDAENAGLPTNSMHFVEWTLAPGFRMVEPAARRLGSVLRIDATKRAEYDGIMPILLVKKGAVEVTVPRTSETQPAPRYIARPGEFIGLFEFQNRSPTTEFTLHATFRSATLWPQLSGDANRFRHWFAHILSEVPGGASPAMLNPADNLSPTHQPPTHELDVFPHIRARLEKVDELRTVVWLFPAELMKMLTSDTPPDCVLPISCFIWRAVAEQYKWAWEASVIDRRIRENGAQSAFENGEMSRDLVWSAPTPQLPHLRATSSTQFLDWRKDGRPQNTLLKIGTHAVVHHVDKSDKIGPLILVPAMLSWPELSWGLWWSAWTDRVQKISDLLTDGFRKRIALRDCAGVSCTSFRAASAEQCPGEDRVAAKRRARSETRTDWERMVGLLNTIVPISEAQLRIHDEVMTWDGDPGELQKQQIVLFTKPDIIIDIIYAEIARIKAGRLLNVVAIQHLIECDFRLLALLKDVAQASEVAVMGKQYSTFKSVAMRLQRSAVKVSDGPKSIGLGEWDSHFLNAAGTFLSENHKHEPGTINLLLDDGGYLHRVAHKTRSRKILAVDDRACVVGVEETTSGIRSLVETSARRATVKYPIVNVAESWAKQTFESPLIVRASGMRCERELIELSQISRRRLHVAVVGAAGSLGRQIVQRVASFESFNVTSVEVNDLNRFLADTWDVVFGCTGHDFLADVAREDLARLKPSDNQTRFISLSSGDVEFRSLFRFADYPDIQIERWPAQHISILDGAALILRAGFPVNFDNTAESVELPYITLTTMLMAAGAYQAVWLALEGVKEGVYTLSPDLQAAIAVYWLDMIRATEVTRTKVLGDKHEDLVRGKEPYSKWIKWIERSMNWQCIAEDERYKAMVNAAVEHARCTKHHLEIPPLVAGHCCRLAARIHDFTARLNAQRLR